MPTTIALQSNSLVTVVVDGDNLGTWMSKSGGESEADGQKTRLGGMTGEIAIGGPASVNNIVVAREWDAYIQAKAKGIFNKVGTAPMSVTYTTLKSDGTPSGFSATWTGVLNRCSLPDADANNNDVAQIELEMLANSSIS